jgi:hypothetical protein
MERKIDRAVDHDEDNGAHPPMSDALPSPLAKASGAALQIFSCQRVFQHRISASGWSLSKVASKCLQVSYPGQRALAWARPAQRR